MLLTRTLNKRLDMRLVFDVASRRGRIGTVKNRRMAEWYKRQIEESFRQRGRVQNCSVEIVEGFVGAMHELTAGDILVLFSKRNLSAARELKKLYPSVKVVILTENLFADANEVVVVDMFWLDGPRAVTKHLIPQEYRC